MESYFVTDCNAVANHIAASADAVTHFAAWTFAIKLTTAA